MIVIIKTLISNVYAQVVVEAIEDQKESFFHRDQKPMIVSLGAGNTLYDNSGGYLNLGYRFRIAGSWLLTPSYGFSSSDQSKNPDEDFYMTTSNGKEVIAIGGMVHKAEHNEHMLGLNLGREFIISSKAVIIPYLGSGYVQGKFSSERSIETANENNPESSRCSNIFGIGYNCNLYELNANSRYNVFQLSVGTEVQYRLAKIDLLLYAEYLYRDYNYSTNEKSQVQVKGTQGAIFPYDLLIAGNKELNESSWRMGLGIKF